MIAYDLVSTPFGPLSIFWWQAAAGPRVRQVFLSKPHMSAEHALREGYPEAQRLSCPVTADLGDQLSRFLQGQPLAFSLDSIALEVCGDFQRRVLLAEYAIPRGWVSTYGRIARHVGAPGASRAVGRSLATNPFPIVIPCHRAVRSDGDLGGYQGGSAMKCALLAMEGAEFTAEGKVRMERVTY